MNLLVSFLYLCLHIAIIIFIAYAIVRLLRWLGAEIDGKLYKAGQIIVALLIIIAVVVWLSGVLYAPMVWPQFR